MQALHGQKQFDFFPQTYLSPQDNQKLAKIFRKHPDKVWIFKPCSSSQGKGIFLASSLEQVPPKQNYIVSEYLEDPYLINGLKFDLRIYVAILSVDPLRLYVHKEGLVRFATTKYSKDDLSTKTAHLTNYSINKASENFRAN